MSSYSETESEVNIADAGGNPGVVRITNGGTMAYGQSMSLLWQMMERSQGAVCQYHEAEIVPHEQVVYLPLVRAKFLREWPGSPNIHTRKATYQRVIKSVARSGGFHRVSIVRILSHRTGPGFMPRIVSVNGCDYLLPKENLSPFVVLDASPVMRSVQPKTTAQRESDREPTLVEAASFLSSPMSCWGEDSGPVQRNTDPAATATEDG